MTDISYYIALALTLYIIGIYTLATKRNMLRLILGMEILINAANINFIAFSANALPGFVDPLGHSFAVVSISIAGSVSAVALVIVVYAYRHYGTLDVRELRRLKG